MKNDRQAEQEAFKAKFGGQKQVDTEALAKELHEAGRSAVEQGATVAAENLGDKARTFMEWDEITETARNGRRMQAVYLLNRFIIMEK